MQNTLMEDKVEKIGSFNGINIYNVKQAKFKTNTINIFFHDNLSRENAARNALIPAVLRRGCRRFPTFQEIALHLEELYGASFDCGVTKKGERQIIQFYIEHVSDMYTGSSLSLFEKCFDLIFEIITQPVLENGYFKTDYVEQEKENLKRLIEGRINDKVQYAVDKCYEEMCADEPFGVNEYGSVKDLSGIDAQGLYEYYKEFLDTLPIDVYVTGTIEEDTLKRVMNKLSEMRRGSIKELKKSIIETNVKEVRKVTENMNVNQGKLSLGFRTYTTPNDKEYYSLVVYNIILGGGMHSKLFQNVREKESLAYYAFSRLEKFKGLMVISSGIEIKNKNKAVGVILKQLDEISNGNISDYEYDSTLKTIETGIKSLKDSQLQIVDFYLSQIVAGTEDNFDTFIEKTKKVTKQDVVDVAKKIKLDTEYFLTSNNA